MGIRGIPDQGPGAFWKKNTTATATFQVKFDKCWLLCSFSFSDLQLTLKQLDCCLRYPKGLSWVVQHPVGSTWVHGTLESALWKKKMVTFSGRVETGGI